MDIRSTTDALKPVAGGAVGGIIVAAIVAFSFNWVYTAGAMAENVRDAKVATLAEVCEANAEHHWKKDRGMKMAKLEGWDNPDREKLAKKFAPNVPNDEAFHDAVVEACNDALQPA